MPDGFSARRYANSDAPKAAAWCRACSARSTASIRSSSKGSPAQAIRGYVFESLMARGYDEPFTLYGLLARTIETDDARSYVTFTLDPAARFSDGTPVTPTTWSSPGNCCAITAGPITAPIIPRSPRPRRRRAHAFVSISATATTANCR